MCTSQPLPPRTSESRGTWVLRQTSRSSRPQAPLSQQSQKLSPGDRQAPGRTPTGAAPGRDSAAAFQKCYRTAETQTAATGSKRIPSDSTTPCKTGTSPGFAPTRNKQNRSGDQTDIKPRFPRRRPEAARQTQHTGRAGAHVPRDCWRAGCWEAGG